MSTDIIRLLTFALVVTGLVACGGGGGGSSSPAPAPSPVPTNGFLPASGAITAMVAQNGNLGSTVLASSPAALFVVGSASQSSTPRLNNAINPAGLAQYQITVSETSGLATSAIAREPQAQMRLPTTKEISDNQRAIAVDGLREIPSTGLERTILSLPRSFGARAAVRSTKANLGDQRTFKVLFVAPGLTSGSAQDCPNPQPNYVCSVSVPATLMAVSQHAYIWVDNTSLADPNEFPDTSYFTTAAANFDRYYAIETQAFGPAWSPANVTQFAQCDSNGNPLPASQFTPVPDITGTDPHIHVLITDVVTANGESGYFYVGNLLSQGVLNCSPIPKPVSNELPMIVIGGANYPPGNGVPEYNPSFWLNADMPRLLSHELQHFLHSVNRYYGPLATGKQTAIDDPWIDEGCSMLAEDIAANGTQIDTPQYSYTYLLQPSLYSLTTFVGYQPDPTTGSGPYQYAYYTPGNYGAAYLFMRYIYDRFGGTNALHALYADFRAGTPGQSNVNPILAAAGNSETWAQLLNDWSLALAAQSTGVTSDPRYGFSPSIVLRGTVQMPSRRAAPLTTRTFVFGGPQPPQAFDPSGNLIGYVTVGTATTPTIGALDGAVNFFPASPVLGGATVRSQTGTLPAAVGGMVQGKLSPSSPTTF